MSDTDAAEANRRAEWLHKHKAPKDWIVLTTSEVSVIREELLAVERERDEAREALGKSFAARLHDFFQGMRFDKNHHLGLGDIRLTLGQQEELAVAAGRADEAREKYRAAVINWQRECYKLRRERETLIEAAKAVVERWEQPSWKDTEPTAAVIYRLRNVINGITGEELE